MTAKKILLTNLNDPLQGELLSQHLRQTDDQIVCIRNLQAEVLRRAVINLQFDEVWHSSTPSGGVEDELLMLRQLLNVMKRDRIPVLNYISNAGRSREQIKAFALLYRNEPLHRSIAEEIEAEILNAREEFGLNYRIFKPPIDDFYNLLSEIVSFKEDIDEKIENYFRQHVLKIRTNLGANLLPLDQAAEMVFKIASSADTLNSFYNIASPVAVSLNGFVDTLAQHIGMRIEHVSPTTALNPIDELFESEIRLMQYKSEEISEMETDHGEIIQAFLKSYTKRRPETVSEMLVRREIELEDGEVLSYYSGGRGEQTIVIVNAYAQGLTYWARFIANLVETYRIIIWLPRGRTTDTADLKRVLINERVDRCEFLGWCTGPKLILEYYSSYAEDVASMIFLGATFKNLLGQPQLDTNYERGLEPLLKMVHDRPQLAGRLKDALQAVLLAGKSDVSASGAEVMQMLGSPCPDLKDAVVEPFSTDEGVVNYAGQILDFWNHDVSTLMKNVRVPVLLITGECDRIASPRMAQAATELIPGARYVEVRGGSHYLQYEKSSLTAGIVDLFLRDAMKVHKTPEAVKAQATPGPHRTPEAVTGPATPEAHRTPEAVTGPATPEAHRTPETVTGPATPEAHRTPEAVTGPAMPEAHRTPEALPSSSPGLSQPWVRGS